MLSAGKSSLHFAFYDGSSLRAHGSFHAIGAAAYFEMPDEEYSEAVRVADHRQALRMLIDHLHRNSHIERLTDVHAVVYRISHGGEIFGTSALFGHDELRGLQQISHLAPEGTANLQLVHAGLHQLPSARHIGVFDTGFFQLLPEARLYALHPKLASHFGIRRYGFQGIMHKGAYAASRKKRRTVSVVIDENVSVAAILNGVGIDATTGFTAADGLPGLHRTGGLDPRIPLYLSTHLNTPPQHMDIILSQKSGIAAMSGRRSYKEIVAGAHKEDKLCIEALMLLAYRISQAVAAMTASLGGIDALVFSGSGAGKEVIEEVCARLGHLGIKARGKSRVLVQHVRIDEPSLIIAEAKGLSRTFKNPRPLAKR